MPYTRREKILDAGIFITFFATVCTVILFALLLTVLRPRCPVQKILPSITVASDGSGDFTTVSAAVAAAPSHSRKYFGIAIKPGVYYEEVRVPAEKTRLVFIGGGTGVTVISSNRSWADPLEDTATLDVKGGGFVAIDITFQNTGDPTTGYTVALSNDAKETAFHHCSFKGVKGVLKAGGSPQFYGKSSIYGAVDVIWGAGSAIFQSCAVYVEKPYFSGGQDQVPRAITFQQRSDRSSKGGFIFQGCSVDASPGSDQSGSPPVFLGRPGGAYSTVVFMQSYLGGLVTPTGTGWLFDDSSLSPATTLYLKEYNNRGPGVGPVDRRITTAEAAQFTVGPFINGDKWLPEAYTEYTPGFL